MAGPPPDLSFLIAKADAKAASGDIDLLQNLKRQKVYPFSWATMMPSSPSLSRTQQPISTGIIWAKPATATCTGAGHALIVPSQPQAMDLNNCTDSNAPFIDACGYDQAGIILQHIYGALNPPSPGQLSGTMQRFDQSVYTKPHDPAP
jgi:poly(3-hydroxybutyrate) depolymerase